MNQITMKKQRSLSKRRLKKQKSMLASLPQQSVAENRNFIDMVINYDKLLKRYKNLISECSPESHKRIESAFNDSKNKLVKIIEQENIKIIDLEGQEYTPNLGVEAINAEDFDDNSSLIIVQMLEPRITSVQGKILNIGKAIIGRKEN